MDAVSSCVCVTLSCGQRMALHSTPPSTSPLALMLFLDSFSKTRLGVLDGDSVVFLGFVGSWGSLNFGSFSASHKLLFM